MGFLSVAQSSASEQSFDEVENAKATVEWIQNMYEHGIRKDADTLFISTEVQNLIANEKLMEFMFPEEYTWERAVFLLNKMELKKAFWFLLNLYPTNKELVLRTFLKYDTLVNMDKVLVSVYYTYAMVDPKVCKIENGKPNIVRPDLVEEGLANLKEVISQIAYYRPQVRKEK